MRKHKRLFCVFISQWGRWGFSGIAHPFVIAIFFSTFPMLVDVTGVHGSVLRSLLISSLVSLSG
jgi:hypothetical protein